MSDSPASNNLAIIQSLTQFTGATQADWNSITIAPPIGMVILALDTLNVKVGDGTTLYAQLPVAVNLIDILNWPTLLAGKANLQHTHPTADIVNLLQPERLIWEGVVAGDGLTLNLPWNIGNIAACDVVVGGVSYPRHTLSLPSPNAIRIPKAVVPQTTASVVYWTEQGDNQTISLVSSLTVSGSNTSGQGGQVTITLSNGQTITITGDVIFQGLPASTWAPGGTLPDPNFTFSGLAYTTWAPGGSGIPAGVIVIQGEGPAFWTATSQPGTNSFLFISLGAGSFLSNGAGLTSTDTLFQSLTASAFLTGGQGMATATTIFDSLDASSFA